MRRLSQSPTDPAFVQDPFPFYERARALGPFFHWEEYGIACTGSATAIQAILRDRRFGREVPLGKRKPVPAHLEPFYAIETHSMLELEPPRHTRLRSLVLRAFTSRRIAGLGPEIERLCAELLAGLDGAFDLLPVYAQPLPVIVIARLLGVPEAMAPDLLRWSNAMVGMYMAGRTRKVEDRAAAAARDFAEFLRTHIAARRSRPADDLITHLIAAEEDGQRLTTDEMISTCVLLLNAGHEATVHTIGNGVKTVLEAGVRAALTPDRAAATAEEILRYDPPLHLFRRFAYADVEVMGQIIPEGDEVGLLLAAAGRDPGLWENPDRFDPARFERPHLAFGAGLHFCVGAPLARLELEIALAMLFARFPSLRLTEAPVYADVYHFHGLKRLMVAA